MPFVVTRKDLLNGKVNDKLTGNPGLGTNLSLRVGTMLHKNLDYQMLLLPEVAKLAPRLQSYSVTSSIHRSYTFP